VLSHEDTFLGAARAQNKQQVRKNKKQIQSTKQETRKQKRQVRSLQKATGGCAAGTSAFCSWFTAPRATC
jgi:hypothetical protein